MGQKHCNHHRDEHWIQWRNIFPLRLSKFSHIVLPTSQNHTGMGALVVLVHLQLFFTSEIGYERHNRATIDKNAPQPNIVLLFAGA